MRAQVRNRLITISLLALSVPLAHADLLEGQADPAFGVDGDGIARVHFNLIANAYDETAGAVTLSNGKIMLAAKVGVSVGGIRRLRHGLARLNADGSLDESFSGDGKAVPSVPDPAFDYHAHGIVLASDGKPIVFGARNDLQNQIFPGVINICRYNVAGNLDTTFDQDGCANPVVGLVEGEPERIADVDVLADNSLLLTAQIEDNPAPGTDWSAVVYKLTAQGAQDFSYGNGLGYTLVKAVNCDWCTPSKSQVLPDGSIYVFGSNQFGLSFVAKLTPSGALDPGFGVGGYAIFSYANLHQIPSARELPAGSAIDAQGRLYHCGYIQQQNNQGQTVLSVARLTAQGELDPSYSSDGRILMPFVDVLPMSTTRDCRIDASGRLIVAVEVGLQDGLSSDFGLMRFQTDGQLDPRFNLAGTSLRGIDLGGPGLGHDRPRSLMFDADGIIVAGTSSPANANEPTNTLTLLRWRDEGVFANGFE